MRIAFAIFAITLILTACPACTTPTKYKSENILKGLEFAQVQLLDRSIMCVEAYYDPCGITLKHCTDGYEYHCVSSVGFFSIKGLNEPQVGSEDR